MSSLAAHEEPHDGAARGHSARPAARARQGYAASPAVSRLQRLQGTAGNRAVSGLLTGSVAVQRDAAACPAPPVAPAGITPDADPRFRAVKRDIAAKASTAKAHPPAGTEVRKAQDAAIAPADDKEAQAKAAQADKMAAARPGGFDKAGFIAAVNAAVARQAPQNLDEADKFATSGKADQIKTEVLGKVTSGKNAAARDITDRTREAPDTGAAVVKPVTPLPPTPAPPAIAAPDATGAVPDKAPADQTDLRADQCETDHKMADAGVTEQQLARSNEPEFTGALAAKQAGERHTAEAPAAVRATEARQLAAGTASGQAAGQAAIAGMVGAHHTAGQHNASAKSATKAKDEQDRARIAGEIKAIFDDTKTKVESVLNGLDDQVGKRFEDGERDAKAAFTADHQARMARYKDDRYSGLTGKARWVRDLFAGLPAEANNIYLAAKQVYETRMRVVISGIADFVGEQLDIAKQHIADGRERVRRQVAAQPAALRKLAGEAAQEFGSQFDDLEKSVDDKQQSLVEDLAQRYVAARGAIDDEIKNLQAENKGLWDKAKDAIGGAIETILKLKDMLLGVLARAANAVELIIAKPIEFLGNLVNAVKTGVLNFAANIVEHLKQGLKGWLLGNLASAGIEIPDSFDAKGILRMVLSILGLTWASVRARILRFIPEPVLAGLEKTVDVVRILVTEGLPGLWKWVIEKLGDLKELVLGEIREFVIEKIVKAGITWIISLLNPAAAFIKACKAIYDIVMFFVDKAAQIKEFVDSVLDSIESIARGGVGAVAGLIEKTLAKAVPMVLGFLASLLGLGGISEKIRGVLEKVQAPVGKVVDTVVGTVVKAGRRVLAGLKRGGAGVAGGLKAAKDALFAKLTGKRAVPMLGSTHHIYVSKGGGRYQLMMASDADLAVSKIDRALASPMVQSNPALTGNLQAVRARIVKLQEDVANADAISDTDQAKAAESALNEQVAGIQQALIAIGTACDIDDLKGGEYVLDGKVHPKYQGKIRITFYGPASAYEHHYSAKLGAALAAKRTKYPDPTMYPDQFLCPGWAGGNRYPHLAPIDDFTLDHRTGAATHWKQLGGNNSAQEARVDFYTSGDNLVGLCRKCNSAKQSDGDRYDPEVGENFRGPGGRR